MGLSRYDRILGGLLGGAIGDSMGAATETRPTEKIVEKFGGYVKEFLPPPDDTFCRGCPAGYVTDDFSLAYYTAKAIVNHKGVIDAETAKEALITWSETPYIVFAGPTTKAAINALKGIPSTSLYPFLTYDNSKASNGSAMKIGPVGLVNPGNLDKAIADAITICMPTHGNNLALSGGCAVAAAVAKAMEDGATVDDIVEAGLYGAKIGYEEGSKVGKTLAGPTVYKRILLAAEIGKKSKDVYEAMIELEDVIGGGLHVSEAVPSAFGLIVAAKGHPLESIYGGVNIGNDTDTVATIVGAIVGALNGYQAYPAEYLSLIDKQNGFDLAGMASALEKVIQNG